MCAPASEPERLKDNNDNETDLPKRILYGFQKHDRPAITELVLAGWIFTLLCEEVRQVI
jgi:hypothetical protein